MSTHASDMLSQGVAALRAAGIADAVGDARRLLADALGVGPDRLTLVLTDPAPAEARRIFAAHLAARLARRPVSRILGRRLFYGRTFEISDAVLDPRPETETLISVALERPYARVLDLGTGSGCILFTLLAERDDATGLGTDLSFAALEVARRNAVALGLDGRADWRLSDWWQGVEGRFDLIVSNPPYIAMSELPDLEPEVRGYDPQMALSPGADALAAYRAIADRACERLCRGGRIVVEVGAGQGIAVATILRDAGLDEIALHPDLDGRDRVVSAVSHG